MRRLRLEERGWVWGWARADGSGREGFWLGLAIVKVCFFGGGFGPRLRPGFEENLERVEMTISLLVIFSCSRYFQSVSFSACTKRDSYTIVLG